MNDKIILDLCSGTGSWSFFYQKDPDYDVRLITLPEYDILTYKSPMNVYGILFAPPCTVWANSGVRWWRNRTPDEIFEAMEILMAGLRIIYKYKSKLSFWGLENPIGKMRKLLGNPQLIFNPCDYGDPYTKKTLIWGNFRLPMKNPVEPKEGSRMHLIPPGNKQKELRSITPKGFARAFYEANK